MRNYDYLIIHCLDTPLNFDFKLGLKATLSEWHMGAKDLPGGKVKCIGKIYNSRAELPDMSLNGVKLKDTHGNGWDRLGYSAGMLPNGNTVSLSNWNNDKFIDDLEITWGCPGFNSNSRHYALTGGYDKNGNSKFDINKLPEFTDLYTKEMSTSLEIFIKSQLIVNPKLKIGGHYQIATDGRTCPNFDVPKYLRSIGIPEINIYGNK